MAAWFGGRNGSWNLYPKHFTERHELFVIIALGETLVVAAGSVTEKTWNSSLLIVSILSVVLMCCLWWIYCFRTKGELEHGMIRKDEGERSTVARDVYSLLHFPLMCGLIIYAFAIEESMLHPDGPMSWPAKIALSTGIFIFSSGLAIANWRANQKIQWLKIIIPILIAAILIGVLGLTTMVCMMIAILGLILLCVLEEMIPKVSDTTH